MFALCMINLSSAATADAQPLVVSGQMHWKPFLMKNKTGRVYGLMYEILEKAAHANGYSLQYRDMPWKRAVMSLEKGKIDIICGIFWNKNRAEKFLFSPPILRNELRIFTGTPFKLEKLIDLQGKRGDKIRGGSYGEYFDTFAKSGKAKFKEVTDDQTAINRLVRGYSDFFIGTYIDTVIKISEQGLTDKITSLPYIIDTVNVYFAYPRRSKKSNHYKKINQTIEQMLTNGTIAETINSYFLKTDIDPAKVIFKPYELRGH
ncbi:transporter substrate-binding domain-containing protein [Desulfovibrio sp. JC022]|uniref:substrate-binding periplasmic protein n=1 Tax=Desulfovibrio sp. JC022 TaxID=2593642 RepID=UPI0013D491AD